MIPIDWSPVTEEAPFEVPAVQRLALINALKVRLDVRPGGMLRIMGQGQVAIVEGCGGTGGCLDHHCGPLAVEDLTEISPHTYWYLLKATGICTVASGAGCAVFNASPYAGIPVTPNPNRPPVAPGGAYPTLPAPPHENVTRYWAQAFVGAGVPFVVAAPPDAFGAPLVGADIYGGTQGTNAYAYGEFAWDVAMLFAKYSAFATGPSLPGFGAPAIPGYPTPPETPTGAPFAPPSMGLRNTCFRAVFGGVVAPTGIPPGAYYDVVQPISPTSLIVDNASGGPTGNGSNEFVFLNPTSGSLGALFGGAPLTGITSMIVDPVTGVIVECDVILERPAASPASPGMFAPWPGFATTPAGQSGGPGRSTGIEHELLHFIGLDHSNQHSGVTGPGGVPLSATPTRVVALPGAPPSFMTIFPGIMSFRDYPGTTASAILGGTGAGLGFPYLRTASTEAVHPDDAAGVIGLYPVDFSSTPAPSPSLFPAIHDFAEIRGRMTDEDGTGIFGRNVFLNIDSAAANAVAPVPSNPYPTAATVSGTARLGPLSIVGASDTVMVIGGTGEFRLIAVPPYFNTVLYCEPWECSAGGIGAPAPPLAAPNLVAEWWVHGILGVTETNPLAPLLPGPGFGQVFTKSNGAYPTSLGSLYCFPGTIIEGLVIDESAPSGQETVSRPAVHITDRNGVLPAIISAEIFHDYQLDGRVTWIVNGVPKPRKLMTAPPYSPGGGPYVTSLTVTASSLLPTPWPPGSTLQLRAFERQDALAIDPVPAGLTPATGINEVSFR